MTDNTQTPPDSTTDSGAAVNFDPANFDGSSLDLGENDDFDAGFEEFADGGQADDKTLAETETQTPKPANTEDEDKAKATEQKAVDNPQPEFTVAQLDQYLGQLSTAYREGIKNLAQQYEDGELTQAEFEEAKLNLNEEFTAKQAYANGEKQKLVGNQQAVQQAWNSDVQAFLKDNEDFNDPLLQAALNSALQAVAKTEAGQKLSNQDLLKQASAKVQAAINKAAANLLQKNRQQRQQRAVGLTGSNAQTSGKKAADNFDDAFDFYASKKTG